jgi:hypothetical protein
LKQINNIKSSHFVLLIFTVISGVLLLSFDITVSLNTVILFLFITVIGFFLSFKCANKLDYQLNLLPVFWLLKILITYILLTKGWIPDLNESTNPNWGYDPQRYYSQAKELIDNNWIFIGGLNYLGILYFFGLVFYLFGHNPFAPALINCLISLSAIIVLLKFIYSIIPTKNNGNRMLIFLLLIPELLWFDVMTSRESFVQFLIIFAVTIFAKLQIIEFSKWKKISYIIQIVLSLLILAFIRTSMLIPVLIIYTIFGFYFNSKKYISQLLKYCIIIFFVIVAYNYINELAGLSSFNLENSFNEISKSDNNVANNGIEYGNNSISQLLFPSNWFQAIVFVPFRIVLYVISPLPSIGISFMGLLNGDSFSYQNLMVIPSSIVNILYFPYIVALTVYSFRNKHHNVFLWILIPFWIIFISVAGGNLIIHERYRLMCSIYFVASGIISNNYTPLAILNKYKYSWYFTLSGCSFFYFIYKFI